jgi:hypothetical protein
MARILHSVCLAETLSAMEDMQKYRKISYKPLQTHCMAAAAAIFTAKTQQQ